MKKFNLLRKSERKSVGTTLALTVGSPSAHRRYSALKHLTFMLLFLLGSLNVWGETYTIGWGTASGDNSQNFTAVDGSVTGVLSFSSSKESSSSNPAYNSSNSELRLYYNSGGAGGSITLTPASGVTITGFVMTTSTTPSVKYTVDAGTATAVSQTNKTYTVTGISASASLKIQNVNTSNTQLRIKTIQITYTASGAKTLTGVTVSGNPSKTSYYAGDDFEPAGLTVKGTYDDSSVEDITSGITWTYNPSQTLVKGQTSIGVTATVNEITSAEFNVTGLSVAAAPVIVSAIEDIEDGASYYIRGVRSSGSVVEYLTFTDGTEGATISGTSASSMDQAIAITFNKVSDGVYQLVTPEGLYVQPGASNGKISLSESATTCTLSNTTKSWDNSATIAISTVDGSSNKWIIQKNTSGTNFGGYKNSQYDVTLVLASAAATVAKPTISGEASFLTSTTVTLTQAEADHIYYTTNGDDPTTSSTEYTAPFELNATATVKAIAVKGSDESDVAEKTFTKQTVLTVAEALAEATGSGKYVTGTITSITEVNIGYKNATYVISDISAGIPQNEMIVYRGKYIDGADFTSADQIHVGDVVVVSGSIAVHAEKNQMAQGNQIETISAAAVSAPVFDPNGGGFVISSDVTITAAGAEHIYYTTNGDNPTKASNEYTGAIHLDATTTIKAIAYVGEESSLVVEKTFTLTDPKTVAEAYDELVSADLENVAVEGIVYDLSISSGNATYWISDDGNAGAKVLEVFKGKGIGGADVAVGDIREGDKVIVFGTLTIYTGGSEDVKEFKQGSSLLSLTRKTVESVAVTGTPTKTNYKVGDAFDPAGLTVTVTYDDASYATVAVADCSWEKNPATFDAAGTGLSVSVKATYDGVQSAAFAVEGLNVKAVPTFDDPNYEWQLVTSDAQLVAGKYYVIGSASKGKTAIKTITSGYLGTVASTIDDGVIAYNALGENTAIFELGGESGAWTLVEAIEEKQLTGATTANFVWDGVTNTTWPISIDGENAIIGASDGYRVLYNVNSPRFKPYNSATNASMVLPQLYVWALKTNKLRYDANGGENAPAAQAAVAGEATVTDAEPTAPADKVFDKWNTQNDGLGADKVAGDVIDLRAGDVTLYAIWRDPNTYSISYDENGGTLIGGEDPLMPENVTEGNAYTVKGNVYEVEGKLFLGWKANDVIYNAGQVIYPTEDMAFVAQWGDPMVTDFMLVTDVKQLKDGDKVYIVADGNYNMALGELNGSVRNPVEIAKQNNHIVNIGNNPVELTLGKSGDDYTFYDGANYLAWTSGNTLTNETSVTNNSTWTITISEGVTTIANKDDNTRKLQYNSSSPRFAAYTSAQKAVSIYKRPDYTRNVSGNYATICLPKAGKIDGASLYEIAYYGETSKKIFFDEIVNGEMEAGIPYIFLPAAGVEKINVYYSDNTAADAPASNRNGLYGFYDLNDPAATHNITQDAGYYILYNNQYWLVSGRAAYVENYRAYIYLADITPSEPALAPGRRRISMSVNDTQTATGIESAEANEASHKVLINGELFILRGEKMYNAKGQLVK